VFGLRLPDFSSSTPVSGETALLVSSDAVNKPVRPEGYDSENGSSF
jgi:hypothetical protein